MFKSAVQKSVPVDKIDFSNLFFKISRNNNTTLKKSIISFGVLDPPVLFIKDNSYITVFGHNRLDVLRQMGKTEVTALLIDRIDMDEYIDAALLKCARNEAGPIGRIRLIHILRDYFDLTDERLKKIVKVGLSISGNLISDREFISGVNILPSALLNYIDMKNISTRTIKELLLLSPKTLLFLERILRDTPFKVNYFTRITEMLLDIEARDKTAASEGLPGLDDSSELPSDKILYEKIYSIRYPNYIPYKIKAEQIAREMSRQGLEIEYPPFFEGDTISLTMTIHRNEDPALLQKKISRANLEKIGELMDML